MSLALYRKYRPGTFAEVKGQDHVTGPLQQALRNGKVHHAYLFSGPRGCGKTSSARILARSLNCEKGPTPDPCGVCDSCVALAPNGPGSLDVVEIDAASHGGVDDARDLRERAFYAPVASPYKIYIIDEAHMVSREGFNALLKLVEEPPEFLRFVFATTEPEKVLATIRSRTHHYPFRLMPRRELTDLLTSVVESEGIAVDPTVLPLVVRAAAGSARDGLSILDQVLASAGPEGVTRDAAAQLLGVTPDTLLDDVIDAFAARDGASVFATVDRVMENGHDPRRFAADVLERLRDLVVIDAVPEAGEKGLLDCPPDQLTAMTRQAASLGSAGISRAADLFHDGLTEMRGTTSPRLLLELICARVLLPAASSDDAAVMARVERLERRLDIAGDAPVPAVRPRAVVPPAPVAVPAPALDAAPAPVADPAPAPAAAQSASAPEAAWPTAAVPGASGEPEPVVPTAPAPAPAAEPSGGLDATAVRRSWDAVLAAVRPRKRTTEALLLNAQVLDVAGRTVTLGFNTAPLMRNFQQGTNVDVLKEALQEVLGLDAVIELTTTAAGPAAPAAPAPVAAAPTPKPAAVPTYEGLAPGDEIEPEDPDNPKGERIAGGEDAAIALLKDQLGGTVLDEG
ncbi:MAG: polymerase subunit gamma and tau [Frankiales bacterium]|nr:polymerase subunit gamma and tau [Frankiales bacterium]